MVLPDNPRPADYKSAAKPTELRWDSLRCKYRSEFLKYKLAFNEAAHENAQRQS
jgi:hypothetical protein